MSPRCHSRWRAPTGNVAERAPQPAASAHHAAMRGKSWAQDAARLRAASTRGVIRARRLIELGVPETTVYRRCRSGGPWQSLLPGVILLSTGLATREQHLTGALVYCGATAMITGMDACRSHGLRRGKAPDDRVYVLVDHRLQVTSTRYLVVERTRRLPARVSVAGFPMAPAVRACCDVVRRLRDPAQIAEVLADAVQRGLCSVPALSDELDRGCRQWTSDPRSVLADVGVGVRSAAELRAKRSWPRTGLPEPMWNARVCTASGELLGVVDAWLDDVAMAVEIDSTEWHLSPADHDRSVAKAARFAASGAVYVPCKPRSLDRDERGVIATFRAAYTQAQARPRPPLIAYPVVAAG